MDKENNKGAVGKKQKPGNKKLKFIWFGISVVIFAIGLVLAKCGISFENYALKAIYAVAVLFPMIIAAQKVSFERIDPETGKKNVPAYMMYYLCIILFIVFIPIIFWVNQFMSL